MPEPDTLCGYGLADVRKSLRDAIERREWRSARRWTAELVATPGAVGSLWSAYWLAWAAAQGAGTPSPTLPIVLKQMWATVTSLAAQHVSPDGDWTEFRNATEVRALAAEATQRLLEQTRQTPVVWPSKEITLYDVSVMRDSAPPQQADGPVVMRVWQRDEDSMELRMMAGRFIASLETGDLRGALSAVTWTLLPSAQQGLALPLKVAERGPASLTPKQRACPIWFWLEIGRSYFQGEIRKDIHRGWPTFHAAIAEAFKLHYKRWTSTERMRVLLAWILQIRASMLPQPENLWVAAPTRLTLQDVDLPYKEIAAELANPQDIVVKAPKPKKQEDDSKRTQAAKMEAKMADADAAVLAALGISADD